MDKLNPSSNPAPEEIKEVREHRKSTLMGQLISVPGLTTYEFNSVTKELKEAEFKTTILESHPDNRTLKQKTTRKSFKDVVHKIMVYNKDCIYFQALNHKNALRKIDNLQKGQ